MSFAPTHARRRRMSNTTRALTVVGALVLALAGSAFGALVWFENTLDDNIERLGDPFADLTGRPEPAPHDPAEPGQAVNVLVLGSDSRISAGDPSQWAQGAQRTDAIMLVHLQADREAVQVVSLPRDSWVPIPGWGENKINAAFSYGGPPLLIETVEQLTGVRIDHFVVTDFESFVDLTDSLGGVQITIPQDTSDGRGVVFTAGVHEMSGAEALTYVRQRYGLTDGDFGRVQRQQNWVRAILGKVNGHRSDVGMMTSFLTAVSESVAADDALTIDRMRELLTSCREVGTGDVAFLTAPHLGTGRSADGQSIVLLDHSRLDPLMAAVADDTAATYVASHHTRDLLPAAVP